MYMCGGGRGHSNYNASLSQPNIQKNNRAFARGRGLKFEKINAGKTIKFTPKKILGIGSLFHSPQPNTAAAEGLGLSF